MSSLTVSDLSEESLAQQRARLDKVTAELAALAARRSELEQQEEVLRQQHAALEADLAWRELMREARRDDGTAAIEKAVTSACEAFVEALEEPADYVATAAADGDGEELLPYSETDDYADFTPVQQAVENCLAEVRELMELTLPSRPSSPKRGVSVLQAQHESNKRLALLRLLVLSVLTGRLDTMCKLDSLKDSRDARAQWEDTIDEVTDAWQSVLYGASGLSDEERVQWKHIVTTFLGEPFDSEP